MENNHDCKRSNRKYYVHAIVFGVIVLALTLSIGILASERNKAYSRLEAVYEKSYYDLVQDVNDIEIKLDKLSVSSSASYQRELLSEISSRADLAQAEVAQLSSGYGSLESTTRYINQLADYTKSLNKKLARGEALTSEEKSALKSLADVSRSIGEALKEMGDKIGTIYLFGNGEGEGINSDLTEMDETSIDYPELIYDGPFADGVINKEPNLSGNNITEEEGLAIAKKASGESELVSAGVWEGRIDTLNYLSQDSSTMVKLAKNGMLLSYSTSKSNDGESRSVEECVSIASEYAIQNGFEDLSPVWVSNYNGMIFVNLVYEENDVIFYNDMVKVKVDSGSGRVVGFDSLGYAYNHKERVVETPTLSEEEAKTIVQFDIAPQSIRLALVPKEQEEILTYEVFGEIKGKKYFIYLDAKTGEEINILCVIDSDEGELLM